MGLFSSDSFTIENGVCTVKFEKKGDLDDTRVRAIQDNKKVKECSKINVVIGEGVTSIGNDAFYRCSNLTSIVIPDSVMSIGEHVFFGCSSLTSIVIPESVTSIGEHAFSGCSSLTSIVIPESVTSIGDSAFNLCSSLTSVVIPKGVTSIGKKAFYYCSSLTSIVIPEGVKHIGNEAFSSCSSLKIYCQALSKPEEWSSSWNSSGRPVVWGYEKTERKKSINEDAAEEWIDVEDGACTVNFAAGVVTRKRADALLADERVRNAKRVTVNLCDGVEAVEELAFYNFDCIDAVNISKSVEKMGKAVFYGCGSVDVFCRFEAEKSGWDECWASRDCHVEFDK